MEKRKWEAPKTMALGDFVKALGDCLDGSTATQTTSDCNEGGAPQYFYENCRMGGLALADCSTGQDPWLG